MKKEVVLLIVVTLIVGTLIGIIASNANKSPAKVTQQPASAPAVNYQQRISELQVIVGNDANNRNAWVQLGHNYFDSNQPLEAIDAYDKALQLDGNDSNVLTDQGIMYRRIGWFDKAIANFNKANELNPNHPQSLFNLGLVYRDDLQEIEKAKKDGQVTTSKEVGHWFMLSTLALLMVYVLPNTFSRLANLLKVYFDHASQISVTSGNMIDLMKQSLLSLGRILSLPITFLIIAALSSGLVQTKGVVSMKSMKPKLSKISPLEGLKRLFGSKALVEFFKNMVKLSIIMSIAYFVMRYRITHGLNDAGTITT